MNETYTYYNDWIKTYVGNNWKGKHVKLVKLEISNRSEQVVSMNVQQVKIPLDDYIELTSSESSSKVKSCWRTEIL